MLMLFNLYVTHSSKIHVTQGHNREDVTHVYHTGVYKLCDYLNTPYMIATLTYNTAEISREITTETLTCYSLTTQAFTIHSLLKYSLLEHSLTIQALTHYSSTHYSSTHSLPTHYSLLTHYSSTHSLLEHSLAT